MLHAGVGFWKAASPLAPLRSASGGMANAGSVELTLTGVAAGNILVVGASLYEFSDDGLPNTVTSSPSLTFTSRVSSPNADTGGSFVRSSIWTSAATSSGSYTITIASAPNSYGHCTAAEFPGLNASDILDATGSASGESNSPTSGSATATAAGRLGLVCYAQSGNSSGSDNGLDLPSGWTNIGVQRNHDATLAHSFDYRVLPTSGAQSAAWGTLNASERWAGCIVILKAA